VSSADFTTFPADDTSRERLADRGLRYGLVDTGDASAFDAWLQAEHRGFHSPEPSTETVESEREGLAYRRTTGVWDDAADDPAVPVATVSSWQTELTLPGDRTIDSWAISAVTVAPTHRRRGVARALLEGELRTASALGVPLAALTVSESTLYGRYGFAPAVMTADLVIERKRAGWVGPSVPGRLGFVSRERFRDEAAALHERVRRQHPGEIAVWPLLWTRMSGLRPGDDKGRALRAVRYVDEADETRGVALYRLEEVPADFTKHVLHLEYLLSETPEAYAALWRFVLETDLVGEVRSPLRSTDEPLLWQISDRRAVRSESVTEHLYLRVLDVPAVLEARGYGTDGELVLAVTDELGFAAGTWRLRVTDGTASVNATTDAAELTLTVQQLSAALLGGVRPSTLLAAAGGVAPAGVDALFASPRVPWLSIWF
jgi:predicted acetyltransferase